VRLLFDQNLSRRLVRELAPWFPDSSHVAALGIATATDREVWAYAGAHGYVIVSKDSDFRQRRIPARTTAEGSLAERRQLRNLAIAHLLRTSTDVIGAFVASAEEALLVLPNLDD